MKYKIVPEQDAYSIYRKRHFKWQYVAKSWPAHDGNAVAETLILTAQRAVKYVETLKEADNIALTMKLTPTPPADKINAFTEEPVHKFPEVPQT